MGDYTGEIVANDNNNDNKSALKTTGMASGNQTYTHITVRMHIYIYYIIVRGETTNQCTYTFQEGNMLVWLQSLYLGGVATRRK